MPNGTPQTPKPQKTAWPLILGLLILLAAVAAGAYYSGSLLFKQKVVPNAEEESELPELGRVSGAERPSLPPGLTTEERQAFQFPGEDASREESILHFQLVERLAEEADSLSYANCVANPVIFKVGKGEQFQALNRSQEEISLSIEDKEFLIPAGGEQGLVGGFGIITPQRPSGTGIYEVACSSESTSSVSLIFVTE